MSKEKVIVGKVNGEDWVSTNNGGVGRTLFKLQDAVEIKDGLQKAREHAKELGCHLHNEEKENAALREALRMKELECEALASDISRIVSAAADAHLSGSEQQHVDHLYRVIRDASGKLYSDESRGNDENQQAD